MTTPQIQQNQVPNEPELKDLLDLLKKQIKLELNCHHIGTIQSFDKDKQIATATVNYKRTFFEPDSSGVYQPVLKNYPPLVDCPVFSLGGGGTSLTFPTAKGDECLLFFNDRSIDDWFSGSSSSAVSTPRLHSISDGIILTGIRSLANVIQGYDGVNPQIKAGGLTATFRIGGGFRLEDNIGFWDFNDNADITWDTGTVQGLFGHGGHVKFLNAMGEYTKAIVDALNAIKTAQCAAPGSPLVAPGLPAQIAILTSFVEP